MTKTVIMATLMTMMVDTMVMVPLIPGVVLTKILTMMISASDFFFRSLPPRESLLKRKMSSKASVFSWKSRSIALNLIEAWALT